MRTGLRSVSNLAFGAAVPASLAWGWQSEHLMLGAAGAMSGLCLLAFGQRSAASVAPSERCSVASTSSSHDRKQRRPPQPEPTDDPNELARRMIQQGRSALLLRPQIVESLQADVREQAVAALADAMAIVPQGDVVMRSQRLDDLPDHRRAAGERRVQVDGFLLDRFLVTNADYQQFVDDGGYEQMALWQEAIWPAVLGFVDRSGQPGPRYWQDGALAQGAERQPVTGICWYEAAAYARWAGKRLPSDAEWVKAGAWPVPSEGGHMVQRKYPWGDAMDRQRANLWTAASHAQLALVDVDATPSGASISGVHQLVGNAWEWTSSAFGAWDPPTARVETSLPLKSIRGGAFDTYFETQCTCQFQSGESPLARKHNIGFRCAVGFCDVVTDEPTPDEAATGDDSDTPSPAGRGPGRMAQP